ncbi:MAG TPA: RIP metalloprotease RseP [Rhizomicrobium sp.]|jgi:regulator of sigma E protease|nr:RIP metalloprotease RseP [Rhizomicrobium sp.]
MTAMLHDLFNWAPLGLPSWLFVITIVVFFHELGHFFVARLFGVRVEVFSIGFGPEVVGWTDKKRTRWKISWIPLGGYVKFFGDADAASRPDREKANQMSPAERAVSLLTKPVYQRALVAAAGPFANFILAIFIFTAMFILFGRVVVPPVIGAVTPNSAAQAAGIKPGDIVRSIDGVKIDEFGQLPEIVSTNAGEDLAITVSRNGELLTLHATPRLVRRADPLGNIENIPTLGVSSSRSAKPEIVRYGLFGATAEATRQTWAIITGTLKSLEQIVVGRTDASQLRGPLGTADLAKEVADYGILALIQLAALMSVSIGLINLFPIPILDGGHLLYYGCEAVLGRPLGERAQDVGFRFGLALVLALMLFATWNDLVRLNLF